ncbi:hypothetical protein GK047_12520 [Paenibacillus sp. SYP-B3998]|uniref:Uncharacterized protein n=1 Tax=Paenibacillus sp. SYP-B3998 TaxID=2678564 RepID=A0A6G3ZXK3_9BACL|nr:hypothetical protein [Paenibacillus sp. SYP-B3998]NEW06835.1 hypothetical protein [Paenibacillus sp. SYP-B3998]
MGAKLITFVLNTMRERANDPTNAKYWLPPKLEGLEKSDGQGKQLPFHADQWSLGELQDTGGQTIREAIENAWWSLVGKMAPKAVPPTDMSLFMPISNPAKPWPELTINGIIVNGLHNIWVLPDAPVNVTENGYDVLVTLETGFYDGLDHQDGHDHNPALPQMQLTGSYELKMSVCAASKSNPASCTDVRLTLPRLDWPVQDITGTGDMTVHIHNFYIDAKVHIAVDGKADDQAGRTVNVKVKSLNVRGQAPGEVPSYVLDPDSLTIHTILNQTIKDIWKVQVINAFENPQTHRSFTEHINTMLNGEDNLNRIGEMLSSQLLKAFDDTLGVVPQGQLPDDAGQRGTNPVDQYAFDRLRYALNSPASPYYLPIALGRIKDPKLDPYQAEVISLGDQSYEGIQFHDLRLSQVQITGLSNLTAPADRLVLDCSLIHLHLQLARPPIIATGQFSMTPQGGTDALTGNLSLRIGSATAQAAILFGGDVLEALRADFQALSLSANSADITISVQIDSAFQDVINAILNQDDIKLKAVESINDNIAQNLQRISDEITTDIQRLIAENLD